MRRVAGDVIRRLQDRYEAHVEALGSGDGDGEGWVGVQGNEACKGESILISMACSYKLVLYRVI